MRIWPALDVLTAGSTHRPLDVEQLVAALDDFAPTGIEERAVFDSSGRERAAALRVFFPTDEARDDAHAGLRLAFAGEDIELIPADVPDQDWGRRSQLNWSPIRVGRLLIVPSRSAADTLGAGTGERLVIEPSRGFGTGHHATTRLCLTALQQLDLAGAFVLDLGTGSGILALAARLCGAREALGLDDDRDALQAARENLARNSAVDRVRFEAGDLRSVPLPPAEVITANLTDALLIWAAPRLLSAVQPRGSLILSGLLAEQEGPVRTAFALADLIWRAEEDGWIGLLLQAPSGLKRGEQEG